MRCSGLALVASWRAARPDVPPSWEPLVERWVEAGVLDLAAADRIRRWEVAHPTGLPDRGVGWPVRLAVGLGGLLLSAGMLLFVAAHWDSLGPGARFTLVAGVVVALHLAARRRRAADPGAGMADRNRRAAPSRLATSARRAVGDAGARSLGSDRDQTCGPGRGIALHLVRGAEHRHR